jgi:DNA-binding GntR family transcriptional regulator
MTYTNYSLRIEEKRHENPFITSTDLAYSLLLEDILSGSRLPGSRLSQSSLSQSFELSRSPIRDAMIRLEEEGYLVQGKKQCYYVYILQPKDALHILEFRSSLEILAGKLAVKRVTYDALAMLKDNLHKTEALMGQNHQEIIKLDSQFHETLVNASKNEYLIETYHTYSNKFSYLRVFTVFHTDHQDILLRHTNIYRNLYNKNAERLERSIREHLDNMLDDGITTCKFQYEE